ncbi:MAG: hypothetical protein MJB57_09395 [Gemmatimonadetes bacterium]|nr:hypothetical protein [Gemmatimonadota bacterium]
MTITREVLDALAAVTQSIGHVRDLSEAIRDGKQYLSTNHPEVKDDLVALCQEMQKSATALATASSIITHFRFVIGDDVLASEAARFNDYLVANKAQAETLRQQLRSMRGHCTAIEEHANKIAESADPKGFKSLAAALGLHSAEMEQKLADALQGIYDEEMAYHVGVNMMADAVEATLSEVQETLGPSGGIMPENVPSAAALLGEYATAFSELEAACNHCALQLQTSIDELRAGID